jgi:hypothetical protein
MQMDAEDVIEGKDFRDVNILKSIKLPMMLWLLAAAYNCPTYKA